MKAQDVPELKWVGIDLHVHTPASRDYKGGRDASEYLKLIRNANQFGAGGRAGKKEGGKEATRNPIGCVALTDHNSVEGFRKYRQLQEETERLSKAIRLRDPANSLVSQLDKDLEVFRSVRVLMGTEIKADPGIHLLIVFSESVEPDQVVTFLEQIYQAPYRDFEGNPAPTIPWTLKQTLDKIQETFSESTFVIFPHVDSSGGVYEDLKDFPQVRIAAFTHPVVRAFSFNRQETREKFRELFEQPDYSRSQPTSMIQSSDFHGEEGSSIGQPRTEVLVKEGKPTFKNVKESFREHGRVKCSIDFVADEYHALVKGSFIAKYVSDHGKLEFKTSDFDSISESVCGMLNSEGGILELEGSLIGLPEEQSSWSSVRDQLTSLLREKLAPPYEPFLFRSFRFSPGKIRIVILITRSLRIHTANGKVFVNENELARLATPIEIELVVSQNLEKRFGKRFEGTLDSLSTGSKLLSKLPHGIPLILGCQREISLRLPDEVEVSEISPASDRNSDATEVIDEIFEKESEQFPFGNPDGNASLLSSQHGPRTREHYLRFTVRRAQLSDAILEKCAWGKIEHPAVVIYYSGFVGLIEPGYIVSNMPAVLLQPGEVWRTNVYALLGWLKSSFFVWYCAVRLGNPSPFMELQWQPFRIPIPKLEYSDFLGEMDRLARNIVAEEKDFMSDINRLKKKGALDSEYQEKIRHRHNLSGNRICMTIDKEVFRFLRLGDKDKRFIAQTLRDIEMTDFGLLDEVEGTDRNE